MQNLQIIIRSAFNKTHNTQQISAFPKMLYNTLLATGCYIKISEAKIKKYIY